MGKSTKYGLYMYKGKLRPVKMPTKDELSALRSQYPRGARVELVKMDAPRAPKVGTQGTVIDIDNAGSVIVNWDNYDGFLNVLFGEDIIKKIGQIEASQND